MSRDPLQTVTIPILLDTGRAEPDGECAVFPQGSALRVQKIRVVSAESLQRWLKSDARSPSGSALRGLGRLKRAYSAEDDWALPSAIEQSRPLMPKLHPWITTTENWSGEGIWDGARWFYVEGISHAMKNARWVMWWPFAGKHEPSPGIYCPDMGTAAAVAIALECVRICPHCNTPFVPSNNGIAYCKPSHGVNYRTAHSRANKQKQLGNAGTSKKPRTVVTGVKKR